MRQFEVREVGTVADAHAALASPFHWILLDLMLPDGNGMELLRRIKRERLRTRVCVMSGCCTEMFDEARVCGAEETLVKPIDVDYLLELLRADVPPDLACV
jgi:DNA-binding response OmpR family regulator